MLLFTPLLFALTLLVLAGWSPSDPGLAELYAAIVTGRYGWLSGLVLIAAIEPAKRWLLARLPERSVFRENLGGLLLAFAMSALAGIAHALIADAVWDAALSQAIVRNALIAIGGYTAIKKAIVERWPGAVKVIGAPMPPSVPPPSPPTNPPVAP